MPKISTSLGPFTFEREFEQNNGLKNPLSAISREYHGLYGSPGRPKQQSSGVAARGRGLAARVSLPSNLGIGSHFEKTHGLFDLSSPTGSGNVNLRDVAQFVGHAIKSSGDKLGALASQGALQIAVNKSSHLNLASITNSLSTLKNSLPASSASAVDKPQMSTYDQWQKHIKADTVSPGTYSVREVTKAVARALGDVAQALVGAAGAAATTSTVMPMLTSKLGVAAGTVNNPQFLALSVGPLLANAVATLCKSLAAAVADGRLSTIAAQIKTFNSFKKRSAAYLETAPSFITKPVRRIDLILERMAKPVANGKEENFDASRFARLLRLRQTFLMSMDAAPKEVPEWRDPESRKALLAKMDKALANYPNEVAAELKSVMIGIAARSVQPKEDAETSLPKRIQIRLQGPGGTGKDHAVHLMEQLLGIPVVEVVMPSMRDGGVDALFGRGYNAIDLDYYSPSDTEVFGPLGVSLIQKGYSNSIVFVNEVDLADASIQDGLKRLLEPNKKSIELSSVGTELPWKNQTVVLASNTEGTLRDADAMESRWQTISFKEASPEMVDIVAKRTMDRTLKLHGTFLSDEQRQAAEKRCKKIFPQLIAAHRDKFPGARISYAEPLFTKIVTGVLEGRDDESAMAFAQEKLDQHYAMYESLKKPDPAADPAAAASASTEEKPATSDKEKPAST